MQYGVEVTERDLLGRVLSVSCRFCFKFGCEVEKRTKRKRGTNVQVFRCPFHTDLYEKHNSNAHREKWSRFLGCPVQKKEKFFDDQVNYVSTLMTHLESESALMLKINRDVVDVIIKDFIFDLGDESTQEMRERALNVFKPLENVAVAVGENETENLNLEAYRVEI